MQNDKLGIFDLLTFIVPGGTLLYFLAYAIHPFFRLESFIVMGDSNYLLVPFFFLSYYVGHMVSFVARKWEYKGMGEKQVWLIYLNQNIERAKRLDALCVNKFGYAFMESETVSAQKSENFFDQSYVLLETKQKSDKIALLMAQFGFFRSAVVVFIMATFFLLISAIVAKTYIVNLSLPFYFIAAFCFCSIFACVRLMRERKRWMMTAVYQNFETYCTTSKETDTNGKN